MTRLSIKIILLLCLSQVLHAQKRSDFEIQSPNGTLTLRVQSTEKLLWSVEHKGQQLIVPSSISLQLGNGSVLGDNARISSSKVEEVNSEFNAINYRKKVVKDHYNQLTLNCRGGYGLIFRIYNDAVAYRFFTNMKDEIIIKNEEANFNFTDDHEAFIPYMWDYRDGKIFNCSFESLYTEQKI